MRLSKSLASVASTARECTPNLKRTRRVCSYEPEKSYPPPSVGLGLWRALRLAVAVAGGGRRGSSGAEGAERPRSGVPPAASPTEASGDVFGDLPPSLALAMAALASHRTGLWQLLLQGEAFSIRF